MGPATGTEVTAREAEVLALIARHLTNAQIADALFISTRTVESHVSAMLRKLQLPDRRSLARHAEAMPGLSSSPAGARLPLPVTPFIGRTAERAALAAALAEHRMVTATGPGGIGKTRLALSVAADLAPARRDGVVVRRPRPRDGPGDGHRGGCRDGRRARAADHVDRRRTGRLARRERRAARPRQLRARAGRRPDCVERIIARLPGVTVLATSRTRLLVPYERVYVVPGLSVVGGGGDAVDLFAARVAAATGDIDAAGAARVAALCRALDGMALAIELAAARFAALGLDGLEAGLDQRLRFLTAGTRRADRHGSLREAIGWSYDLLAPDDRHCYAGSPCSPRGSTSTRRAPSPEPAATARRSPTAWPAWPNTACSSSNAASRPGIGRWRRSASTASSSWTRPVSWTGPGRPRAVVPAGRRRASPDRNSRHRRGLVRPVRPGRRRCRCRARLVRRRRAADGRRRRAGRRARRAAVPPRPAGAGATALRAGRRTRRHGSERATYLRLAAGAAASRYVGDEALRLFRTAADAAVSVGDRAGAARDLATMAMYINRAPGIMATPHSRAEADALVAEARALSDGSPRAQAALAVASSSANVPDRRRARDEPSSSPSGPATASCTASPWTS